MIVRRGDSNFCAVELALARCMLHARVPVCVCWTRVHVHAIDATNENLFFDSDGGLRECVHWPGVRTKTATVQPRRTRASVAMESTRKDLRTGKIYVGEPEPLEELADLVGRSCSEDSPETLDGLLGPAPVPIPIPVEDEREQATEEVTMVEHKDHTY